MFDTISSPIHTLVVSDVHLGSRVSRAGSLLRLLRSYRAGKHRWRFNQLLLLGDIFDGLNFDRLTRHAWQVVGLIREITDEKSNAKVIWVAGNHDLALIDLMSHLVGVTVYEEYEWQVADRSFLAMHGHQFDKWIMNYPTLSRIPAWIYEVIQQLDGPQQRISRYVKEKSKKWLRINDEVAQGLMKYAHKQGKSYDALFAGHTHFADAVEYPETGSWYYNSGCWTGKQHPNFITVDSAGEVQLQEYVEAEAPMIIPVLAASA
ncbi:MAG: UDP-2,3-diacylglucosamine diphosphatase [bacterium]